MASKASIILRTGKTAKNKHGILHVKNIPADNVCVLYLGGNLTEDDRAASGNAKVIEQEILPDISEHVPVYSVAYSFDADDTEFAREVTFHKSGHSFLTSPRMPMFINVNAKNIDTTFRRYIMPRLNKSSDDGANVKLVLKNMRSLYISVSGDYDKMVRALESKLTSVMGRMGYSKTDITMVGFALRNNTISESELDFKYINDIFEHAILPRISDNNGTSRLKLNDAMRRVRAMNIVAHCHGAYVVLKLEEKMTNKMRELGYDDGEISKVLSQMLVVSHAPSIPMGVVKSRMISFISANDDNLAMPKNWIRQYVMAQRAREYDGKIDNKWMPPMFLGGKYGNVFVVHNAFTPEKFGAPRDEEHNNTHYIGIKNQTNVGQLMALISGNVIKNGIKNSLSNQSGRFRALPPTHNLILGGVNQNWLVETFKLMRANGRAFMRAVYKYATENVKSMRTIRGMDGDLERAPHR